MQAYDVPAWDPVQTDSRLPRQRNYATIDRWNIPGRHLTMDESNERGREMSHTIVPERSMSSSINFPGKLIAVTAISASPMALA